MGCLPCWGRACEVWLFHCHAPSCRPGLRANGHWSRMIALHYLLEFMALAVMTGATLRSTRKEHILGASPSCHMVIVTAISNPWAALLGKPGPWRGHHPHQPSAPVTRHVRDTDPSSRSEDLSLHQGPNPQKQQWRCKGFVFKPWLCHMPGASVLTFLSSSVFIWEMKMIVISSSKVWALNGKCESTLLGAIKCEILLWIHEETEVRCNTLAPSTWSFM